MTRQELEDLMFTLEVAEKELLSKPGVPKVHVRRLRKIREVLPFIWEGSIPNWLTKEPGERPYWD